jgi:hypothetical protein
MPRELITIQVGQCGNQLGARFWELALREHSAHAASQQPSSSSSASSSAASASASASSRHQQAPPAPASAPLFDDSLSSFFRNVDTRYDDPQEIPVGRGTHPIRSLKARAICIDMEEGVLNQLMRGPIAELFDERQLVRDVSGAGNNWAHGYCGMYGLHAVGYGRLSIGSFASRPTGRSFVIRHIIPLSALLCIFHSVVPYSTTNHTVYGEQYADSILEAVRRCAEPCDSLQVCDASLSDLAFSDAPRPCNIHIYRNIEWGSLCEMH